MSGTLSLTLKIWRQPDAGTRGQFETYQVDDVSPDMSFLEMLDVLNERLIREGQEPVAFDHDCREGICGTCGIMINGQAHGPDRGNDHLPAPYAAISRTGTRSSSSRGERARFRS